MFNGNILPEEKAKEILFNAGGVYNHQIYFESIGQDKNKIVESTLKKKLEQAYGTIENFINIFKQTAKKFKGSGYIFLVCNEHNELTLFPVNNQDTTVPFNMCPLMCIDLWEHAYIYDYGNNKGSYIDNFCNIINWETINKKYEECLKYLS